MTTSTRTDLTAGLQFACAPVLWFQPHLVLLPCCMAAVLYMLQQTAASAAGSNPSADNDRAQNQVSTATAPTPSVSQAAALATELLCFSGRDRLSDAVVHAVQSSPAQQQDKVQQKQVQQQQQQQHEKHGVGVAWSIPAAYGVTQLGAASEDYNDIDLLANR